MGNKFAKVMFTDSIKYMQEQQGSRTAYARHEKGADFHNELGPEEKLFVESRDSFYISSVGETGWPYIQHRGGPQGFLKVIDKNTLGFADYVGNRQYITVGNLLTNDKVSLFLMDYPSQTRMKIIGHAKAISEQDGLDVFQKISTPSGDSKIERGILITVVAFDWNCPQNITPRWTEAEIQKAVKPLQQRILDLESALKKCQNEN